MIRPESAKHSTKLNNSGGFPFQRRDPTGKSPWPERKSHAKSSRRRTGRLRILHQKLRCFHRRIDPPFPCSCRLSKLPTRGSRDGRIRSHMVRYPGVLRVLRVLPPAAKGRSQILPQPHDPARDEVCARLENDGASDNPSVSRSRNDTWAQLLRRVFAIDISESPPLQPASSRKGVLFVLRLRDFPGRFVGQWVDAPETGGGRSVNQTPVVGIDLLELLRARGHQVQRVQ